MTFSACLAIQDCETISLENLAIQDLYEILFSDNPAIQDLNYWCKTFALLYEYLF